MTSYSGGDEVSGGVYWNRSAGEFITVPAEGGRLAGSPSDAYFRTSLPLTLILGPLMGAAFTFLLPLSGMLVLAPSLATRLRGTVSPGAARMASPQALPGVSYLQPETSGRLAAAEPGRDDGERIIRLAEAIVEERMRQWQK